MTIEEIVLKVLENSPMAVVLFWMLIQQRKDNRDFIDRNDKLVDTQIANLTKIGDSLTPVIAKNNILIERLERKLDETTR